MLEPGCGQGTVAHLLHVAHLGDVLLLQVVHLRVCKCTFTYICTCACNMHIRICVVAAAASGKRARAGGTGWHKARDGTCPAAPASIGVELFAGTVGSKT